jgi:hypothetical protein
MNRLLAFAILAGFTVPSYAEDRPKDIAKLKEDARRVVGIIGADKGKTQTYCQFRDLNEQLDRALEEKDRNKAKALAQKINAQQKKLGPEFVALVDGIKNIDPDSPDGRDVASIIESLDASCD